MMALKKLFKSFVYAFSGICNCIKTCRNFRIHTVAAAFVLYLSGFYDFTPEKYALLFILIGLVLALFIAAGKVKDGKGKYILSAKQREAFLGEKNII